MASANEQNEVVKEVSTVKNGTLSFTTANASVVYLGISSKEISVIKHWGGFCIRPLL